MALPSQVGFPGLIAPVPLADGPEGAKVYCVVYPSTDAAGPAIGVTGVVIISARAARFGRHVAPADRVHIELHDLPEGDVL